MAIIGLERIQIRGLHGVMAHEKVEGNDFTVDIEVEVPNLTVQEDDLGETLDYGDLYQIVRDQFAGSVNLLETLVNDIGTTVLAKYPTVSYVRVRIRKLNPPIDGPAVASYVEDTFYPS